MTADILILGATGFTGRQITKYLSSHPQRSQFTFAIAGRTASKLRALIDKLALVDVPALELDITSSKMEEVVKDHKVVINTVGPYGRWGTHVVLACAKAGTHYVDLSSEPHWTKHIIKELESVPSRSNSLIVPGCAFVPLVSDIGVFLSVRALRSAYGTDIQVGSSITAHEFHPGVKRGFSKGSLFTGLAMIEDIPRKDLHESVTPYYLSPVKGTPPPPFRLSYTLPLPSQSIKGAFSLIGPTTVSTVERTWGLLQVRNSRDDRAMSYGPHFNHTECIKVASAWHAVATSLVSMLAVVLLLYFPPIRWLLKHMFSAEYDEEPGMGHSESINVTKCTLPGEDTSYKCATSTFAIKLDPGYMGSSVIISECALALLFTPRAQLPQGGEVLTPVTALGAILVGRLSATGVIEMKTEIVADTAKDESRKNI